MASILLAVIFLVFVSLGLPDSLLGSAWPTIQNIMDVSSSYAGYVSMAISFMTIISALLSPRLIKKIETKWIIIVSISLTIIGLLGFSFSSKYWMLILFAIPYGLGAGAIDASINHYVSNNYSSRVMNFLHCFYGLGAIISPNIMALALKLAHWNEGYRWTAYIQIGILLIVILSLPLWKMNKSKEESKVEKEETVGIFKTLKVPGVILTLVAFFAYCSAEATCFLWTSSYFEGTKEGISEELIASFGSLIFGGLMLGRIIAGLVSNKLGDRFLIRAGIAIELVGIILLFIPDTGYYLAVSSFLIIGLGMGPIYPAIQHMAPVNFGKKYSAAVIGLQMASAYVGSTFMPTIFGYIQESLGIAVMPIFLIIFAVLNFGFLELTYLVLRKRK